MSKAAELAALIGSQTALSNRNLIINGAMQVAQRGTSSTGTGYQTVDRFQGTNSGLDESNTQAQVDVASGTTPYSLGFRKAFRITNGNQTSGADAGDIVNYRYIFEAQDIANSGWDYTSSSSYVTLSFWAKSSVAQTFYGHMKTFDGTVYNYPFSLGALSADTWTKVTKTIPGNSGLQIDNDNGQGLEFRIVMFYGTDRTASVTENAWAVYDNTQRTPDNTSTWYTTNDATFEITGVQLEVGEQATPFEHRSFADELHRCQRYYAVRENTAGSLKYYGRTLQAYGAASVFGLIADYPVTMRATPTVSQSGTFGAYKANSGNNAMATAIQNLYATSHSWGTGGWSGNSNLTAGHAVVMYAENNAKLMADAEL
jgi:hypothetical protein